jgi:cell division transport system permease protein
MLRSDLPLDRDAAGFFLPAIIGFMVFLAALALAGSMGLDNLLARWRSQIDTAFTIELPPIDGESAAAATARRQAVMAALGAEPGVESATPVSEAEKARLLAPWLGADVLALDLPLPDLIGVAIKPGAAPGAAPGSAPGAAIDIPALTARLGALSPGAAIDDHGRWRGAIAGISHTVRRAALGLLLLIGAAAALTVVFVARAGLAAHRRVIEILHLIGAHDAYIAGQFQRHAFTRGLLGGVLGALAGALVFAGGQRLLPELADTGFGLSPLQWAELALLPLAAALLAMATARYTVLAALAKMM